MIEIKTIGCENKKDINIPNEPFSLFGRMIPCYVNEERDYTIETFLTAIEIVFPDENYDFDELSETVRDRFYYPVHQISLLTQQPLAA